VREQRFFAEVGVHRLLVNAHLRLVYHSALGSSAINNKNKKVRDA
jgi:hypothetical protein